MVAKYTDNSPNCTWCDECAESYFHFYWECTCIQEIWTSVKNILDMLACVDNDFTPFNCLFSNFQTKVLVILSAFLKYHLFLSRHFKKVPSVNSFLIALRQFRDRQHNKSLVTHKLPKHFSVWGVLAYDHIFDSLLD